MVGHRFLIETALRELEPRAVVSLRGGVWVIVIPLGQGSRVTITYPAAPVANLAYAVHRHRMGALDRLGRMWASRAETIHFRACEYRTEMARSCTVACR